MIRRQASTGPQPMRRASDGESQVLAGLVAVVAGEVKGIGMVGAQRIKAGVVKRVGGHRRQAQLD